MESPDETLSIQTPENVVFGYEIAGIGSRFLAALVDSFIVLLLEAVILISVVLLMRSYFSESLSEISRLGMWLYAIIGLLLFILYWGYYIFFEMTWNGQSPGKRWLGLRVIRTDGTPITLAESIIRNLMRVVDILPTFYGVGVVVMFISEQSRRLGDLAAGTLVVREQASVTLESLATKPAPIPASASSQPSQDYPVNLLRLTDINMAEDFIRRREQLFNRQELAYRIARSLCERMGLPDMPIQPWEAEKLIDRVVQAYRTKLSDE
jgi:uncharacterized RDD family membrane protein YckC